MPSSKVEQTVRRIASALPDVQEGIVCNRVSFEAGKKRFLFLESDDKSCLVMLKLKDSLPEAQKLTKAFPDCYKVGTTSWVTSVFAAGQLPPPGLFERWIEESYRLLVPKKLIASVKPGAKKSKLKRKTSR
jgi:hypothetical protein